MMTLTDSPKIYVASLSDYNAGRLHGAWIDLTDITTADEIREAIDAMLAESPEPIAEEWAIHDYDNFPNLGEWPDLEKVASIAETLAEVGENGLTDAFMAWIDNDRYNLEHPENFRDAYEGEYDDEADYGYQWAEEIGVLKQLEEFSMDAYIDWDRYGTALLMDCSTIESDHGTIYVFRND